MLNSLNKTNSIHTNKEKIIYGQNNYTEFEFGNLNILLSVPHDGHLKPSSIKDRITDKYGNIKSDKNTRKFAIELRDELKNLFSFYNGIQVEPFMIYNNLHRTKMDPNRDISNCCSNSSNEALHAYKDYHSMIDLHFKTNFILKNNFQQGLILDIHGNSHFEEWVELGYLINKFELNSDKLKDNLKTSIDSLKSKSSYSLDDIIRGDNISLGSLLQKRSNIKVVPSPEFKSPFDGNYYCGGFITERHGSCYNNFYPVNSIQIELPFKMRDENFLNLYAKQLAHALFEFYSVHSLDSCK